MIWASLHLYPSFWTLHFFDVPNSGRFVPSVFSEGEGSSAVAGSRNPSGKVGAFQSALFTRSTAALGSPGHTWPSAADGGKDQELPENLAEICRESFAVTQAFKRPPFFSYSQLGFCFLVFCCGLSG